MYIVLKTSKGISAAYGPFENQRQCDEFIRADWSVEDKYQSLWVNPAIPASRA